MLYRLVRDWAAADKNELILDVCCGTGTIGLCMSRGVCVCVCVCVLAHCESRRSSPRLTGWGKQICE